MAAIQYQYLHFLECLADPSQWVALYDAAINSIEHDFIQTLAKTFDGLSRLPFAAIGLIVSMALIAVILWIGTFPK